MNVFCFVSLFYLAFGQSTTTLAVLTQTTDGDASEMITSIFYSTSSSPSSSPKKQKLSNEDCSNANEPSGTFLNMEIVGSMMSRDEAESVTIICKMIERPTECKDMIKGLANSTQLYIRTQNNNTSDEMIEYKERNFTEPDGNAEIRFVFHLVHRKHHQNQYYCKSSNNESLVLESDLKSFGSIHQKWDVFMKPTAIITKIGSSLQLTCHTNHTDAAKNIIWQRKKNETGALYSENLKSGDNLDGSLDIRIVQNSSVLTLTQTEEWIGQFRCKTFEKHSKPPYAIAYVAVEPKDKRFVQGTSIACSTIAMICILVIIALFIRKRALQKKIEISMMLMDVQEAHVNAQSPVGVNSILNNNEEATNCYSIEGLNLGAESLGSEPLSVTFNRITLMWESWQKDRSKLTIKSVLGEGNFGSVCLGIMADVYMQGIVSQVAVKTIKASRLDKQAITEFEKEISIMTSLHHEHIVSLIGLCTETMPLYIIMEYMENGQLNQFLMDKAPNKLEDTSLTTQDLLHIGRQPCSAVEYLADKNIVHRDISARNCLVGKNLTVKLADFGLSRGTGDAAGKNYYKKDGGMVPVKWMSPEALTFGKYTTSSDVWACGVLLWEIFSFGAIPYQGYSNQQAIIFINEGGRLNKPHYCPEKVWNYVCLCWTQTPEDRITIGGLFNMLSADCV